MPVLEPDDIAPASASSWRMPWMTYPGAEPSPPAVGYVFADGRGKEEIVGQDGVFQHSAGGRYSAHKALAATTAAQSSTPICITHAKFFEVYKTTQSHFEHEVLDVAHQRDLIGGVQDDCIVVALPVKLTGRMSWRLPPHLVIASSQQRMSSTSSQ